MSNQDLIKSEQGPRLAFLEKPDVTAIAETLVAFANTEGGTIVFGLQENGETAPKSIDSKTLEKALKDADANCNPPVVVGNWEESETEMGTLYTLRIPRSIELHALIDGRVLIRSGVKNRPLGGQEILKLASAKSTGDFESEVVPGATIDDFSNKMIVEYLSKRAERTKRPYNGKIADLLKEIGAVTEDGSATVSGVLLFSEYPQHWIPQSSVVFAKFVGKTPRGETAVAPLPA